MARIDSNGGMANNANLLSKTGTVRLAHRIWPMLRFLLTSGHRTWLEQVIEKKFNKEKPNDAA